MLVTREQGRRDRRQKIVLATSEGEGLHAKAEAALENCEREQLSSLTAQEAGTLRALLRKAHGG